jgi:hypothetical protein
MLKSPSVLMLVVMGGLMLCMKQMQKNMDPEQLREMQEQQAAMTDPMSMLKNMFGGGDAPATTPTAAQPAARVTGASGAQQRRVNHQ